MALDFPDTPTLDELHDGPGGQRWRWDGTKWVGLGNAGPAGEDGEAGAAAGLARLVEPLTVPAIGGTVTVEVDNPEWFVPGLVVFVEGGPSFAVVSVNAPDITLMRLGSGTVGESGVAANLISHDADNLITTGSDDLLFAPEPPLPSKMGVIDGSNAAPGEIGEFIESATVTAATTGALQTHVSLVIPPGDWDVSAFFTHNGSAAYVNGTLALAPDTAFSGGIENAWFSRNDVAGAHVLCTTYPVRLSITVATTVYLCFHSAAAGLSAA